MSKTKLLTLFVIGLLLSNVAVILFMQFAKPRHSGHERPKNHIIKTLHLNENQILQYDELIKLHQKNIGAKESSISRLKNQLYSGLTGEISAEQRDSLLIELGKIQSDIEIIHYKHFEDIRSLCGEEQLKYFGELSKELSELFSDKRP